MTVDKKVLEKTYCYVEANKTAEYYTHISYDYIIERIAQNYPPHVSKFLYAEIEHNKAQDNRLRINKILDRVMGMYGIILKDLIADHRLQADESYDNMTVADMDSDRVEIKIQNSFNLNDIEDIEL